MNRLLWKFLLWSVVPVLLLLLANAVVDDGVEPGHVSLSELLSDVREGKVREVSLVLEDQAVEYRYVRRMGSAREPLIATGRVDPSVRRELEQRGVRTYERRAEPLTGRIAGWLVLLLTGPMIYTTFLLLIGRVQIRRPSA